jgi:FkbM family methyltransferase
MSFARKLIKLGQLLGQPRFRSALIGHRIAATVEHLDAIRFCAPASLIDIGANKGQFATAVRGLFPEAVIHAFEPLPTAGARFAANFAGDKRVTLHRVAVGATERTATFYVTDREDSSSLLRPGSGQKAAFGVSSASQIDVPVRPLDKEVDLAALPRPILLKIDVQGAELEVLKGIASLDALDFLYVELSFVELYEGQALFEDVRSFLADKGFTIRGVFNQAFTPQFGPTQADCLFVRA